MVDVVRPCSPRRARKGQQKGNAPRRACDDRRWKPLALNPASASRGAHFLNVIARLKPGVTEEQAALEKTTIAGRLSTQYPVDSPNESAAVVNLQEQIVGNARPALLTLLAAVAVLTLIACANVANLLLVRASARQKEIAFRAALGATRLRILTQMLAESLVLAAAGGAVGLFIAYLAITPIQMLGGESIPRATEIVVDLRVLGFTTLASLVTGVLFGLALAWHASRDELGEKMKDAGRSAAASSGQWLRSTLLVIEVGLCVVLLVAAALLLRSFDKLISVDPGFDAERVLAFQVSLPRVSYRESYHRIAFYDELLRKLEVSHGVRRAGMVQTLPMRGSSSLAFSIEGRPPGRHDQLSANYRVVSPGYFESLGIRLLRGRALGERDDERSPQVAMVDETFVRRHLSDQDPVGRRIRISNGSAEPYEIVGVVGRVRSDGLHAEPGPTMDVPYKQDVYGAMWIVARAEEDPMQLAAVVRHAVREIDPTLPAYSITPSRSRDRVRYGSTVLDAAACRIRSRRALSRGRRSLWRRRLYGEPAHTRDRAAYGDRRTAIEARKAWGGVITKAKVRVFRFHDLRHRLPASS